MPHHRLTTITFKSEVERRDGQVQGGGLKEASRGGRRARAPQRGWRRRKEMLFGPRGAIGEERRLKTPRSGWANGVGSDRVWSVDAGRCQPSQRG